MPCPDEYVEEELQQLACGLSVRFINQPRDSELARAVNSHKEIWLVLCRSQFGDVLLGECGHSPAGQRIWKDPMR